MNHLTTKRILTSHQFTTKLGEMLAITNDNHLCLLEFTDRRNLQREIDHLKNNLAFKIVDGKTIISRSIKSEMTDYLNGVKNQFETPFDLSGSLFRNTVWKELLKIPAGNTQSYLNIATAINKPSATRAVANAIGANQLAIIVPCHRVINTNGNLGGYAGGIARKQWLLEHEMSCKNR